MHPFDSSKLSLAHVKYPMSASKFGLASFQISSWPPSKRPSPSSSPNMPQRIAIFFPSSSGLLMSRLLSGQR